MVEFKFPDVGEGIEEGEIVKWLVKPGDKVKENQIIGQIETDKAVVDMPSPAAGKITEIRVKEGESVKVGEVMIVIGGKGEKSGVGEKEVKKSGIVVGEIDSKVSEMKYRHGELEEIRGGKKTEIKEKATKFVVKKKFDDFGAISHVPLKGIRKTIARHMLQSVKEAPQVTSMMDIDVTKLWDFRDAEKVKWEKKGIKLTFLPFIVKACVKALRENPMLNSSIVDEGIVVKKYVNMGIATSTDAGLMVPVIKIAQNKSVIQIAKEIKDLSEKARTRKINVMDLKGGSFTITNYGSVGGNYGAPIINYPEAAILGVGRIFDRVALDGEKVMNRKILPVSVTFDHRILDGAQAARFLVSLGKYLGEPGILFKIIK